ncbi:MAG: hypothetical protein PVS3B3_04790 [Ktedonobacteraceae bacterium]
MGQYRQWLHYRHVDQQLQTQKEQLTKALIHLREHINHLNAHPLAANNRVVQALMLYTKILSTNPQALTAERPIENGHIHQPEIISQTLFDHSRPPNIEPLHKKDTHEPVLPRRPTNTYTPLPPLPPIPHRTIDLITENTDDVLDAYATTETHVALPWWLHNATLSATRGDTQSMHTNRLVQRWLERWGRQEEQRAQSTNTNGQQLPTQQESQQQ